MDEFLFRRTQNLENLQIQLKLVSSKTKEIIYEIVQIGKEFIFRVYEMPFIAPIIIRLNHNWDVLISISRNFKQNLIQRINPAKLYASLAEVFWKKWTKKDVCLIGVGFVFGTLVGATFTHFFHQNTFIYPPPTHFIKAIQYSRRSEWQKSTVNLHYFLNPPHTDCAADDVIVSVKAASLSRYDVSISEGYRKCINAAIRSLNNYNYNGNDDERVIATLGRDAAGVITDVGRNVKHLEVGDSVWVALPQWSNGTLADAICVSKQRVGLKPQNISYQGACSIPYAGCVALDTLERAGISEDTALDKRILIDGGCTPVGCVLVQILSMWGASVTAVCYNRATAVVQKLGAKYVINLPDFNDCQENGKILIENGAISDDYLVYAQLESLEKKFEYVIVTEKAKCGKYSDFCDSPVIHALPQDGADPCAGFTGAFYTGYLYFKHYFRKLSGFPVENFDEVNLNYKQLDKLADFVKSGHLLNVVDKVFLPHNFSPAMAHVQSKESIGSTVISFL